MDINLLKLLIELENELTKMLHTINLLVKTLHDEYGDTGIIQNGN